MEDKKVLTGDELEKVVGGASVNLSGSKLEITLSPNESASMALQQQLASGISFAGRTIAVEDPTNCLMTAAAELDQPEVIGLKRTCLVAFTMVGFVKVIIGSVEVSY